MRSSIGSRGGNAECPPPKEEELSKEGGTLNPPTGGAGGAGGIEEMGGAGGTGGNGAFS